MDQFEGRVAFVTGGASGIGFGMARCFAREGMKVFLADVEPEALEKAIKQLTEETGADVAGAVCDVADHDSVDAAGQAAIDAFSKIHVLCNNAGVSPFGKMEDTTPGDWEWVLGVNLMGVVHGLQTIVPRIREHGEGGHVVNTASVAGLVALPVLSCYTASKYAVVGISETVRAEFAEYGIGVSVVCPAFVKTRLLESDRNRPSDTGGAVDIPDFMPAAIGGGMDPEEVGAAVVKGIRENRAYILTHPETKAAFEFRASQILADFDAAAS